MHWIIKWYLVLFDQLTCYHCSEYIRCDEHLVIAKNNPNECSMFDFEENTEDIKRRRRIAERKKETDIGT